MCLVTWAYKSLRRTTLENFSILRSRAGPTYYKLLRNFVVAQESEWQPGPVAGPREIPLDVIDKTHKSRIRSVVATQKPEDHRRCLGNGASSVRGRGSGRLRVGVAEVGVLGSPREKDRGQLFNLLGKNRVKLWRKRHSCYY